MAKWISDPVKGMVPANEAAELIKARQDVQDGTVDVVDLKKKEAEFQVKADKLIREAQEKDEAARVEREIAHASSPKLLYREKNKDNA